MEVLPLISDVVGELIVILSPCLCFLYRGKCSWWNLSYHSALGLAQLEEIISQATGCSQIAVLKKQSVGALVSWAHLPLLLQPSLLYIRYFYLFTTPLLGHITLFFPPPAQKVPAFENFSVGYNLRDDKNSAKAEIFTRKKIPFITRRNIIMFSSQIIQT